MTCAWQELLAVLPLWMRKDTDRLGAENLREIRMRKNCMPELVLNEKRWDLERKLTQEDLNYTVNAASRYSPWAAGSAARGYITIKGGHRIGLCGEAVFIQGEVNGFHSYSSLCIRIARDFPGIAASLDKTRGSILVLGAPGWGKTTFLRDLVRQIGTSETVCVVDEREELFPDGFDRGKHVDVLSGCSKEKGITMLLRTMGPDCIAVDEITAPEDTTALLQAANCGIRLLASAHAESLYDFQKRLVYRPLMENHIFDVVVLLKKDRTYTVERMTEWFSGGSVRY